MANTLAEQLAAGDPDAFAALYDRLATRLFNTARTMTASLPDAEDAVHDLFVELARCRDKLARVSDLDAYVFTMLRHAVSRRRRRRQGCGHVCSWRSTTCCMTTGRCREVTRAAHSSGSWSAA